MIFNIVAMYLYAKGFEALTEKPHHTPRREPEREDLSKRSFSSSDHSQVDRQTSIITADIARLISPDCQDRPEVARGIQKVAEAVGHSGNSLRTVAAIEQSLTAVESLVTDEKQKCGIRDSLALAIAALTRGSSPAWQGWGQFLGNNSSEEVVHAALTSLRSGNRNIFGDAESRAAMLAASGRSERCREAVMLLEPLFSSKGFAENRERLLLLGQHSMEYGESNERTRTVKMFNEVGMAQELIASALTVLEKEFEHSKTAGTERLQLSSLNTVMYCFPRHLFEQTVTSQQAWDALPRLEKLRDHIGALVTSTKAGWGDNSYANFLTYVCENIKVAHDFGQIADWSKVLIPQLKEPVYLSCQCAFEVLRDSDGARILTSFNAHATSPQAKAALPALEKLFESVLSNSIAAHRDSSLSAAVGRLDALCSLIAGKHNIERTTSVESAIQKMEDRWLVSYAEAAASRPADYQLPYRAQVDSVVATRAATIVKDTAARSDAALREFTASLIRESGASRPFYDLVGKAADKIALASTGWGKTESVSDACIKMLNALGPKERVEQLVTLSNMRQR